MRTHSPGVSRSLPTRLGFTVTRSGEPSLGPRPQYAGFQIPTPRSAARCAVRAYSAFLAFSAPFGSHSAWPSASRIRPTSRQRPPIRTASERRSRSLAWLDVCWADTRTRRWLRRMSCSKRAVASSEWHSPRRRSG